MNTHVLLFSHASSNEQIRRSCAIPAHDRLTFQNLPEAVMSKLPSTVFRCVRQERISIRESVCPSVRWCVRNACAKAAFLGWFRPRWDLILNLVINKRVFRASFTLSLQLSVHLYLHIRHIFSANVNTRRDTVRTHRCPVGLVSLLLVVDCRMAQVIAYRNCRQNTVWATGAKWENYPLPRSECPHSYLRELPLCKLRWYGRVTMTVGTTILYIAMIWPRYNDLLKPLLHTSLG